MKIKKSYALGDTVWVYGISRSNNKLTKGTIVHSFTLEHVGYNSEPHYVVSIPNSIEPLLEVRTWHNISQDEQGPVGCFRQEISKEEVDAVDKKLSQLGLTLEEEIVAEHDDPTPDQIHAALEKSQTDQQHPPLNLKTGLTKSKPKYRTRKKKV